MDTNEMYTVYDWFETEAKSGEAHKIKPWCYCKTADDAATIADQMTRIPDIVIGWPGETVLDIAKRKGWMK